MIKRGLFKTKMIFGTGDIRTYAGCMNINGKIYGTIASKNGSTCPIGKLPWKETFVNAVKCPVIMMFSNVESFDCMMQALECAKKAMLNAEEKPCN